MEVVVCALRRRSWSVGRRRRGSFVGWLRRVRRRMWFVLGPLGVCCGEVVVLLLLVVLELHLLVVSAPDFVMFLGLSLHRGLLV